MEDNFKILSNWNDYLSFFDLEHQDIYFTDSYLKLYESENEKSYCFYYFENDFHFLLPYILREFRYKNQIYYDFETVYGYGGPIYNYLDESYIERAWHTFFNYGYSHNFIAGLVRFHPLLNNYKYFDKVGGLLRDRETVAIDLRLSEEEIWRSEIHTKNRNSIQKGERNALQFVADYQFNYLPQFKLLYKNTMLKHEAGDFYYFNDDYFTKLKDRIEESFLGTVIYNGEVIASSIIFYYGHYGHYHLSGSNPKYLNLSPNNFLLWGAAKELKRRGVKYFHLGGGTNSDENNSLLQYKSKFSKTRYDFYIGKIIFNNSLYNSLCDDWSLSDKARELLYQNHLLKYKY